MAKYTEPFIHTVEGLPFPEVEKIKLSNGLPIYMIKGGSQPVVKIEIVFLAGRPFEKRKLVATACASILRDGTSENTSAQLAEKIDFFGASISAPFSFDTIKVQLHCLSKHLPELLPIFAEIIRDPAFPEEELQIFRERIKQRLAVDLSQNEILAYRKATELFFGASHPYGYNSSADLYDGLERSHLQEHYDRLFAPVNAYCIISGIPPSDVLEKMNDYLGDWQRDFAVVDPIFPSSYPEPTAMESDREKSQTAIRIGRRLFNRQHPDFAGLFVLNTALGGFFGSRLMRNLREDKGFTYGIESSVETMRYDGYLTISLETERHLAKRAIEEIHREIYLLQTSLISESELKMVKNYLAGYLLSLMDGPLQVAEILRGNLVRKNEVDFTIKLLGEIQQIGPIELKNLATKYLQIEELTQVVIY